MAKKKSKKDKIGAKKDKKREVKKPVKKAKKKAAKAAKKKAAKAAKAATEKRKSAGKKKAKTRAKKLPRGEPSDDEISEKAYELFRVREAAGEHGDPLDDWEKARQILRGDWTR